MKVSWTLLDLVLAERRRKSSREELARVVERIISDAMKDPGGPWSLKDSLGDLLALCDYGGLVGPAIDKARVVIQEAERRELGLEV